MGAGRERDQDTLRACIWPAERQVRAASTTAWTAPAGMDPELGGAAVDLLGELGGSDPAAWDTALRLAPSLSGTGQDLLAVLHAVLLPAHER